MFVKPAIQSHFVMGWKRIKLYPIEKEGAVQCGLRVTYDSRMGNLFGDTLHIEEGELIQPSTVVKKAPACKGWVQSPLPCEAMVRPYCVGFSPRTQLSNPAIRA